MVTTSRHWAKRANIPRTKSINEINLMCCGLSLAIAKKYCTEKIESEVCLSKKCELHGNLCGNECVCVHHISQLPHSGILIQFYSNISNRFWDLWGEIKWLEWRKLSRSIRSVKQWTLKCDGLFFSFPGKMSVYRVWCKMLMLRNGGQTGILHRIG